MISPSFFDFADRERCRNEYLLYHAKLSALINLPPFKLLIGAAGFCHLAMLFGENS